MKRSAMGASIAIVLAVWMVSISAYVVSETEQALIIRLGAPIRVVSTPGLNFKVPLIDSITFYDSRQLLLDVVGRAVSHAGQTMLYLTPMHAEVGLIKSMIANVHAALKHVRRAAEQLPKIDRWAALLAYICQRIVGKFVLLTPPPTLAAPG